MNHLYAFFLVGPLAVCSLNAEMSQPSESISHLTEEVPLTKLDESLSFFAEEFETEIASLEEPQLEASFATKEEVPAATPDVLTVQETPIAIEETPIVAIAEAQELKTLAPEEPAEMQVALVPEEEAFPLADEAEELNSVAAGLENEPEGQIAATLFVNEPALIGEPAHFTTRGVSVDLQQAFGGSPIIYSILLGMSIFSVALWLYSLASIRLATRIPSSLVSQIQNQLSSNNFSEALNVCSQKKNLLSKMLVVGIQTRKHGLPMVVESMKAEAKRSSVFFWQKISLLNDIAIIAPMLGLLGTVLGMFYAFYDVNRSIESISTLFDGLGISVGTTVAGLVVAILSLILHSTAKYRLVRALAKVENQAQIIVPLLDDKTHIHQG